MRAPQALLLAASISPADADALATHEVEVHSFARTPSLPELAAAALELRKQHPTLPLLVAGPPGLLKQLQRRYPPLVDIPLTATSPTIVLRELQSL